MNEETKTIGELNFDVFVHTIQFLGNKSLSDTEIKLKSGGGSYSERNGQGRYSKVNPNHCGVKIESLSDTEDVIDMIVHDLQIEPDIFLLERFDLAVNTPVKFDDAILYKLNLYLASLYAEYLGTENSFRISGNDLIKRSIEVRKKGPGPQLSIYNKNVESKGRNPAKTRIEWRFVNQTGRCTMRETIMGFCKILDRLPSHIEKMNEQKVVALIQEFERIKRLDNPDGRIDDLPTFVKCHSVDIFNRDILMGLHRHYYSGQGRNWLRRYRGKSNSSLYLINKYEIIAYIRAIQKAIRQHLKTHSKMVSLAQENFDATDFQMMDISGFIANSENRMAGNL